MNPADTKILVVDDIRTMRNVIKGILRNLGFTQLLDAEDGNQALGLLRSEDLDLVICDWNMPKMNGLEVLETMRSEDALRGIPFIMVTAENSKARITKAIESGTDEYVVKPFNEDTMRTKIANALKKR
ncbi:MAG: response regulator [Pseudomonadota bacterium]